MISPPEPDSAASPSHCAAAGSHKNAGGFYQARPAVVAATHTIGRTTGCALASVSTSSPRAPRLGVPQRATGRERAARAASAPLPRASEASPGASPRRGIPSPLKLGEPVGEERGVRNRHSDGSRRGMRHLSARRTMSAPWSQMPSETKASRGSASPDSTAQTHRSPPGIATYSRSMRCVPPAANSAIRAGDA